MNEQAIPELDRKGLRHFGITTGAIVVLIFGLFFPWLLDRAWPLWPWLLCAVLALWGLAAPMSLRPVYRGWMRFGLLASRVMTPLIMGIIFYLLITPFGLVRRMFGKDTLPKRFDPTPSYRVPSRPAPAEKLRRPF